MRTRSFRNFASLAVMASIALTSCAPPQGPYDLGLTGFESEPVEVSMAVQRLTATHEAAHAVALIAYYGPDAVNEIYVRTACCAPGVGYDVGATTLNSKVIPQTVDTYVKVMAMYYAGEEAERQIFGLKNSGSGNLADMVMVKRLAEAYAKVIARHSGKAVDQDVIAVQIMLEARGRAHDIVRDNADAIRALATAILAQPEVDHLHTIDRSGIMGALKGIEIVRPMP